MNQCRDCRFWIKGTTVHRGECRKRAPVPMPVSVPALSIGRFFNSSPDAMVTTWPKTMETDFCGEFEAAVALT